MLLSYRIEPNAVAPPPSRGRAIAWVGWLAH